MWNKKCLTWHWSVLLSISAEFLILGCFCIDPLNSVMSPHANVYYYWYNTRRKTCIFTEVTETRPDHCGIEEHIQINRREHQNLLLTFLRDRRQDKTALNSNNTSHNQFTMRCSLVNIHLKEISLQRCFVCLLKYCSSGVKHKFPTQM